MLKEPWPIMLYYPSSGTWSVKAAFSLLISIIISSATAAQPNLDYRLEQNKTYRLSTVATQGITQVLLGSSVTRMHTEESELSFRVTTVLDSFYKMQVQFERLGQRETFGGQETYYSSDSNGTSVQSTLLHRFLNKSFDMTTRKDFSITAIDNFETLFTNLFQGFPITEEQQAALKESLLSKGGCAWGWIG